MKNHTNARQHAVSQKSTTVSTRQVDTQEESRHDDIDVEKKAAEVPPIQPIPPNTPSESESDSTPSEDPPPSSETSE